MTDVVTGASGAAGRAVIEALHGRGAEVAAVSHSDEGKAALREAGVEQVFDGDLTDPASLRAAFAEARAVYSIPPALHPREGVLIENALAAAADAPIAVLDLAELASQLTTLSAVAAAVGRRRGIESYEAVPTVPPVRPS